MAEHQQPSQPRVEKVDSEVTWDALIYQAKLRGCPVVVQFTASWCMPSVAMESFIEEAASSYRDILFLVVDVDEVKEVASKMEIKAMPTFLVMRRGIVVDKVIGANPHEINKRIAGLMK